MLDAIYQGMIYGVAGMGAIVGFFLCGIVFFIAIEVLNFLLEIPWKKIFKHGSGR